MAPRPPAHAARLPLVAASVIAVAAMVAGACGGSPRKDAEPPAVDSADVADPLSAPPASALPDVSDRIVREDGAVGVVEGGAGGADGAAGVADGGAAVVTEGPGDAGGAGDTDGTQVGSTDSVALPDGPVAPLTGLLTTDTSLAQRRAVAVKVDNNGRRSRPQAGLAAADIVYEVLIEGARTRFLAVFHSDIPCRVGPVRSARSGDISILADLATPFLASSGANNTVLGEVRRAHRAGTLVDIGGLTNFTPYGRDPARRSPYNLYFHYENLLGSGSLPGGALADPVQPLFEYGSSNPSGLADATGVTVTYHRSSGNVASHVWDAVLGGWVRIQSGSLLTTETDLGVAEVAPANVAVLWMPYKTSDADVESPQVSSFGSGDALLLTAGAVHNAVWERTEDRVGFRFADTEGDALKLSPGSTWLLLANSSRRFPVAEATVLTAADGASLLAEARVLASPAGNVVTAT